MRRGIAAVLIGLMIGLGMPSTTMAQQMPQPCAGGEIDSRSMYGVYLADEYRLRLDIAPCGGVTVLWASPSGTHRAIYSGNEATPGGGFIARVIFPDPIARSLDNRNVIWVKPAEAGWIQVVTMSPFGDDLRVYRLRKI